MQTILNVRSGVRAPDGDSEVLDVRKVDLPAMPGAGDAALVSKKQELQRNEEEQTKGANGSDGTMNADIPNFDLLGLT